MIFEVQLSAFLRYQVHVAGDVNLDLGSGP